MPKETVIQVKIDSDLKKQVEDFYQTLGISFDEAVRIFARKSVEEKAVPINVNIPIPKRKVTLGIADGQYSIPDDFDECNNEIASMFGLE